MTMSLKDNVLGFLNEKAKEWGLNDIRPGKEDPILAVAVPKIGLPGIHDPLLLIKQRGSFLDIQVRNLVRLGRSGNSENSLVAMLIHWLFTLNHVKDDSKLSPEQVVLMRQAVQLKLQERWTVNDILSAVISGSNDASGFTRAVKDCRTGEIWVNAVLPAKPEEAELPALFSNYVGAVLQHTVDIYRLIHEMRERILPDDIPFEWPEVVELLRKISATVHDARSTAAPRKKSKPKKQTVVL